MTIDVNRLLLVLIILTTFSVGIYVQLKDRRSAINTSFNIMAMTIVVWTFCIFMILTLWRYTNPIIWVRASYSAGTLMTTSFTIFSLIFSYGELRPVKKFMMVLIPLCIFMAILSMTNYSVVSIDYEDGKIKNVVYGIGNIIWAIFVISCLIVIQYFLISKWRKGNGIERLKIKYMYLGVAIATTCMLLTNITLPILGFEKAIGYGPVSIITMLGFIAYSIVKHRLMDIRIFIRKGIVYSVLMAIATVVVGLIVIGIPSAFPELEKVHSAVVVLIGGGFIIFAMKPFYHDIKEFSQVFILKDQYRNQSILANFSSSVAETLDMEKLLELIFNTTIEAMRVDNASLWMFDSKTGLFKLAYSCGVKSDELAKSINPDSPIESYLQINNKPIAKDELAKLKKTDVYDELENEFNELKAEIAIPLMANNQLIGVFYLGNKHHNRMYFEEDIAFLKAIMSQSSVAIQNAKLHKQVVNMEKLSLLGRLSAELAHEIKNPLVTIKTAFEFIVSQESGDSYELDDNFKVFCNLALGETNRIDRLIKQLLMLGRPSPPKFEWCDANKILDETILLLKRNIEENSIELIDKRDNTLIEIYADKDQLKQVFINIAQNSIEAMKNGGKLEIAMTLDSDFDESNNNTDDLLESKNRVIIKISDTGEGMTKEELKNIFEPFYTQKVTGTGLGLAIVSNIIREHNGIIEVESVEGSGTTFTINIPQVCQGAKMSLAEQI